MDFLQKMAERSRERASVARRALPEAELAARAMRTPAPPRLRLSGGGFDLIAEIKLRSPALGALKPANDSVEVRAAAYGSAGAAAVSVLTEPSRFDGSMTHLEAAARSLAPLRVPAMRKDFLVDPYQVAEARAAGAGGVLLIVRMLAREELDALLDAASRFDLFVLLEAFDERDIDVAHEVVAARRAGTAGQRNDLLVGVNCRDLVTLQVVPGRLEQLAARLPDSVPRVAESGVSSADDACSASAAGYDMALVGGALMQAGDPAALARDMLEAGRKR